MNQIGLTKASPRKKAPEKELSQYTDCQDEIAKKKANWQEFSKFRTKPRGPFYVSFHSSKTEDPEQLDPYAVGAYAEGENYDSLAVRKYPAICVGRENFTAAVKQAATYREKYMELAPVDKRCLTKDMKTEDPIIKMADKRTALDALCQQSLHASLDEVMVHKTMVHIKQIHSETLAKLPPSTSLRFRCFTTLGELKPNVVLSGHDALVVSAKNFIEPSADVVAAFFGVQVESTDFVLKLFLESGKQERHLEVKMLPGGVSGNQRPLVQKKKRTPRANVVTVDNLNFDGAEYDGLFNTEGESGGFLDTFEGHENVLVVPNDLALTPGGKGGVNALCGLGVDLPSNTPKNVKSLHSYNKKSRKQAPNKATAAPGDPTSIIDSSSARLLAAGSARLLSAEISGEPLTTVVEDRADVATSVVAAVVKAPPRGRKRVATEVVVNDGEMDTTSKNGLHAEFSSSNGTGDSDEQGEETESIINSVLQSMSRASVVSETGMPCAAGVCSRADMSRTGMSSKPSVRFKKKESSVAGGESVSGPVWPPGGDLLLQSTAQSKHDMSVSSLSGNQRPLVQKKKRKPRANVVTVDNLNFDDEEYDGLFNTEGESVATSVVAAVVKAPPRKRVATEVVVNDGEMDIESTRTNRNQKRRTTEQTTTTSIANKRARPGAVPAEVGNEIIPGSLQEAAKAIVKKSVPVGVSQPPPASPPPADVVVVAELSVEDTLLAAAIDLNMATSVLHLSAEAIERSNHLTPLYLTNVTRNSDDDEAESVDISLPSFVDFLSHMGHVAVPAANESAVGLVVAGSTSSASPVLAAELPCMSVVDENEAAAQCEADVVEAAVGSAAAGSTSSASPVSEQPNNFTTMTTADIQQKWWMALFPCLEGVTDTTIPTHQLFNLWSVYNVLVKFADKDTNFLVDRACDLATYLPTVDEVLENSFEYLTTVGNIETRECRLSMAAIVLSVQYACPDYLSPMMTVDKLVELWSVKHSTEEKSTKELTRDTSLFALLFQEISVLNKISKKQKHIAELIRTDPDYCQMSSFFDVNEVSRGGLQNEDRRKILCLFCRAVQKGFYTETILDPLDEQRSYLLHETMSCFLNRIIVEINKSGDCNEEIEDVWWSDHHSLSHRLRSVQHVPMITTTHYSLWSMNNLLLCDKEALQYYLHYICNMISFLPTIAEAVSILNSGEKHDTLLPPYIAHVLALYDSSADYLNPQKSTQDLCDLWNERHQDWDYCEPVQLNDRSGLLQLMVVSPLQLSVLAQTDQVFQYANPHFVEETAHLMKLFAKEKGGFLTEFLHADADDEGQKIVSWSYGAVRLAWLTHFINALFRAYSSTASTVVRPLTAEQQERKGTELTQSLFLFASQLHRDVFAQSDGFARIENAMTTYPVPFSPGSLPMRANSAHVNTNSVGKSAPIATARTDEDDEVDYDDDNDFEDIKKFNNVLFSLENTVYSPTGPASSPGFDGVSRQTPTIASLQCWFGRCYGTMEGSLLKIVDEVVRCSRERSYDEAHNTMLPTLFDTFHDYTDKRECCRALLLHYLSGFDTYSNSVDEFQSSLTQLSHWLLTARIHRCDTADVRWCNLLRNVFDDELVLIAKCGAKLPLFRVESSVAKVRATLQYTVTALCAGETLLQKQAIFVDMIPFTLCNDSVQLYSKILLASSTSNVARCDFANDEASYSSSEEEEEEEEGDEESQDDDNTFVRLDKAVSGAASTMSTLTMSTIVTDQSGGGPQATSWCGLHNNDHRDGNAKSKAASSSNASSRSFSDIVDTTPPPPKQLPAPAHVRSLHEPVGGVEALLFKAEIHKAARLAGNAVDPNIFSESGFDPNKKSGAVASRALSTTANLMMMSPPEAGMKLARPRNIDNNKNDGGVNKLHATAARRRAVVEESKTVAADLSRDRVKTFSDHLARSAVDGVQEWARDFSVHVAEFVKVGDIITSMENGLVVHNAVELKDESIACNKQDICLILHGQKHTNEEYQKRALNYFLTYKNGISHVCGVPWDGRCEYHCVAAYMTLVDPEHAITTQELHHQVCDLMEEMISLDSPYPMNEDEDFAVNEDGDKIMTYKTTPLQNFAMFCEQDIVQSGKSSKYKDLQPAMPTGMEPLDVQKRMKLNYASWKKRCLHWIRGHRLSKASWANEFTIKFLAEVAKFNLSTHFCDGGEAEGIDLKQAPFRGGANCDTIEIFGGSNHFWLGLPDKDLKCFRKTRVTFQIPPERGTSLCSGGGT